MSGFLFQAFVYLCAAVIAVPITKRLGLGSVQGYLLAGIAIGPVIGLVGMESQEIQHFAEFGIVMMLFLVGLELQPRMLWEMRSRLIGLGGLQVGITAALITGAALLMGLYWSVALTIGLIFSLSSTAIVLQTLKEKGLTNAEGGRASFSVLLLQDIAVIPMLALIPLLAIPGPSESGSEYLSPATEAYVAGGHQEYMSLVAGLPGWAHALVVLGAVAIVLLGGHFLSRPMFRFIAESRLREIFTASALLLVIGIALLMTMVDLSPALGVFLAGVVLANSEYRHELKSNVEPFKGLLLGLFFMTVGAGIDFGLLFGDLASVLGLTLGVMVLKGLVLYGLAHLFRLDTGEGWLFTLSLAQAGEFAFVLLSFGVANNVLPPDLASTLLLVVALSMLLWPLFLRIGEKVIGTERFGDIDARPLRVFISYSRKDKAQTHRLLARLELEGFEVFVDFRDLPYGEEWQRELDQNIRRSDIVIWLVSTHSIQSRWCNWELGKVSEYSKRLVPVLIEEVEISLLPDRIRNIQVFPRLGVLDFNDQHQIQNLIQTLRNDHIWFKEYTRLAERGALWNSDGRSSYWLLRKDELGNAKSWLRELPDPEQEIETIVLDLISSSEIAMTARVRDD